jgi:HEAT repeat protein
VSTTKLDAHFRGLCHGLVRRGLILVPAILVLAVPVQASQLDAASPEELIEVLKANVYLTGDIVKRMEAQRHLQRFGKQDPQAVVPLILEELAAPRSYGKMAAHQRLALIELLRDIGPAAEASVPLLVEILQDPEEPYDSVKTQAAMALGWIGTAEAKAAAQAFYAGLSTEFADTATDTEADRSASQSAFLIRQELRSRAPSDGVISASVGQLRALGARAAPALPTLLRAYNDPRLGTGLREEITTTLQAAGVADVEAAAARAAAAESPDLLAEVIAEIRSEDSFIRGLAMTELGRMEASEPAIDAMIDALREGRNPGDAARVLGDFGEPAERALPEIVRYFDDERAGANAIQAAGKIGVKDPSTITGLRRVLAVPDHRHRGMAARALGVLHATEALPELVQVLSDGGKYDRILAASALGQLGHDAAPAVGALSAVLDDPDLDLRRAAVEALGRIGDAAAPATAAIAAQLKTGDGRLQEAARRALAAVGGPDAEIALDRDAGRFADADLAEARRLAMTSGMEGVSTFLTRLPDRRALALAHGLLGAPDPDSALSGALFLARHGVIEPAVPILADNLARRPDAEGLLTGLAYSMMHGGDETQIKPLFEDLSRFIRENRDRYSAEEWARLEALFQQSLQME